MAIAAKSDRLLGLCLGWDRQQSCARRQGPHQGFQAPQVLGEGGQGGLGLVPGGVMAHQEGHPRLAPMLALQNAELTHPGVPLREGSEARVVGHGQELDRKAARVPTFWRWYAGRVVGWL